jgi:hypothetical protein
MSTFASRTLRLPARALRAPINRWGDASQRAATAAREARAVLVTLLSRTHGAPAAGLCASCETHGPWDEYLGYYRCTSCGHDPIEHAERT